MKKRNIYIRTWEELSCEKNMIFLTGPRQAGKTTLARMITSPKIKSALSKTRPFSSQLSAEIRPLL